MSEKTLKGTALLEKLSLTFGPSGCEEAVADAIIETVSPFADEVVRDRAGGVIAILRGTGKAKKIRRVMLSAHMDEVGFMISSVEDDGTLRISPLSARDPKILAGQYVTLSDGETVLNGVVGIKPYHLKKDAAPDYADLYIDIGAGSREEAEKVISKGFFGTFCSGFVRFGQSERMIKGKALDDRLGCTVLCDTLREIRESGEPLPFDLFCAFTCREELGISGAACAAEVVEPDAAIVFEATAVADVDGVDPTRRVAEQGRGGAVSYADRGTVYDRGLYSLILETGKKYSVPCQPKKYVSGGNDASFIRRSGKGVRVAAVSAPSRYIHTASNVVREDDFLSIEKLAPAVLREIALKENEL